MHISQDRILVQTVLCVPIRSTAHLREITQGMFYPERRKIERGTIREKWRGEGGSQIERERAREKQRETERERGRERYIERDMEREIER